MYSHVHTRSSEHSERTASLFLSSLFLLLPCIDLSWFKLASREREKNVSCVRSFTSCNTTSRDPERAFGLLAALLSSEREEQGGITADRRLSINYYCSRVREISLLHYIILIGLFGTISLKNAHE